MKMKKESFPFVQLAHDFKNVGLLGKLEWVNAYGKKRYMDLFWRMRAALKKALKNGGKQQLRFQYDPSSYALNFDDGCCRDLNKDEAKKFMGDAGALELTDANNTTRVYVYVLRVKTE